jgi:uncharacterized membrane protein YccF (DUF307 family)
MRVLLNVIWLVFGGLWLALGYALVALVMFILIITIPFGIASARIALFCLWPFGREIVDLDEARRLGVPPDVVLPADPARR